LKHFFTIKNVMSKCDGNLMCMRRQGLVGVTIHICLATHAIWCGSYVFGGSEWPSGPSRVDQMDPPKVISAKIVRPSRGLGGDDALGVPGAGGRGAARGRSG
ncbi:conserved hypothetical protein, partial [Trichinella spiralis]|uniref:hypothetical protein n=1 Tax=Trichinella spiralis TaxID=6334 RepID=UPI0001EFD89F